MNTIEATLNRAIGYHQGGKLDKAESLYRKIVKQDQNNADAWHLLGVLFYQMGELDIAEQNIQKAITIHPNSASFYSNLGLVYHKKQAFQKAIQSYRTALGLKPDYPEALNNLGNSLKAIGLRNSPEHYEALACYQKALQLAPNYPDALNNLATLLVANRKSDEAVNYFETAIRLNPSHADAYANLGLIHKERGDFVKAAAFLEKALALPAQSNPLLLSNLYEIKRDTCEWEEMARLQKVLIEKGLDQKSTVQVDPFITVAKLDNISKNVRFELIKKYALHKLPAEKKRVRFEHKLQSNKKLRIGYLTADLFDHPTMHLISGLFAYHDRERFDITLFSLHHDENSSYFKRAKEGADHFVDLTQFNDVEASRKIYDCGIDILIDLGGWTKNARQGILAHKPAPLQVQYLAFAGTTANDAIDYMITDETITPLDDAGYYSEEFIYMPASYQVNDQEQMVGATRPSRKSCHLPEDVFVFCCFNRAYKIEPVIFDVWMEILRSCEKSVLWLLSDNDTAKANLKREAQERGVDPDRLIFAPKVPKAEHLARLKNADLVLDTYSCNAHTTASDALFAGVPLLTCKGDEMASRIAASLLVDVGLDECITLDLESYKQKAILLSNKTAGGISILRNKLKNNKNTASLFRTERFAKGLEKGLNMAWENYLSGITPRTIRLKQEVQS